MRLQGDCVLLKRVNNLYPLLISDDNLKLALLEVNHSHRWLPHHRPNRTVAWVESDIPARVKELRQIIEDGFDANPVKKKRRYDKSAGKWRDISEPLLWPDQYIHHALVQVLEPVMMRGMDRHCCGSIRGPGIHYGMRQIKRWMKEDVRGTRYCLELDIHHFYDSLKPEVVMQRLRQLVKDHRTLDLAERILSQGVLIGVYCSQWFANTTLQPLDHMIREGGYGVTHYLRYMDNFTIFGPNKRKLPKLLEVIRRWLGDIKLTIKDNWQVFPTASRMPTALGYRYGHGYTLLKKRNLLRLKRQLNRYYRKKRHHRVISRKLAAGLLSRLGQCSHCNSTKVFERIYHGRVQKDCKDVIRRYARKERLQWSTFSGQMTMQELRC